MSNFLIHLKVPPYLAQYYIHKRGGEVPVKLQRGTPEADVIEYALRPWPLGLSPVPPADANLVIEIPFFKRKDPRTYNYLPPKAAAMLKTRLRLMCRMDLWDAMMKLQPGRQEQQEAIYLFMEKNGIKDDETNLLALQKMFQRQMQDSLKKKRRKSARP